MTDFKLDPVLQNDCVVMGKLPLSHLLLMNNAGVPWLILVPENQVSATEIIDLSPGQQTQLLAEIASVSALLKARSDVTKLNVAALGNIVSQLHVHVVARNGSDYCWPKLVWASPPQPGYSDHQITEWRNVLSGLPDFVASGSRA